VPRVHSLDPDCRQLLIRPWHDPIVDVVGYDPRSPYVERFWLGSLGPSATWFLRYIADHLDASPEGFVLDLAACAAVLGLGWRSSRRGGPAFPRTVRRCCQFRIARLLDSNTLEVRRAIPPLTERQVEKLPEPLRLEHARWIPAG
jgi:hypothetical protein